MLTVLGQITLIVVCALALCIYVGWGATRLGLPAGLRRFEPLCVPLVGYAIAMWGGYVGVSTVLNLRWSLGLLLALATAVNILAWRRGARPALRTHLRDHAALLPLLAITLLVGVLPLLHYGFMTAIGQGWDTESYLPLAQHLQDHPVGRIAEAPANPLRDLASDPPRSALTLGFSVFHGMTMLLSGQSALATFAPLMALLRAFGILAIYIWLQSTMGLRARAALLGAALASAGSLLLWVTYFNFGMQLAAWPLLALGLALGVAAVDDLAARGLRAWPAALVAGLALAALPVAYYPALAVWGPLALALGIARVAEIARGPRHQPGLARTFLAAAGLVVLVLVLAALTVQDYFEGFDFQYSLISQSVGPDRFIPPTDTLGLTAFRLPATGPQPPNPLVMLAAVVSAALVAAGLALPTVRPPAAENQPQAIATAPTISARLRWFAVLAALLGYLAWLRFGRPYEYAYMKSSAYAGWVLWGAAAFGWQTLRERIGRRAFGLAAIAGLVPLLVAGWAQALTVADHWDGPAIFTRDIAAFDQAADQIPSGATVAISSDPAFTGPISGVLSTFLYGREIWGHLVTAYTGHDYWPEGGTPQYALLAADERPWPLEVGGQELWRSNAIALYRLDERTQMFQGRTAFYSAAPPVNRKQPAALAIWRRMGPYHASAPGERLTLQIGDTLHIGPGQPAGSSGPRQVRLTLAALQAQTATLTYGDTVSQIALTPGVNRVELQLADPTTVEIVPEADLALIDVIARRLDTPEAAGSDPLVTLDQGRIAWSVSAEERGGTIGLRVSLANPGNHALRLGLTVIEDRFSRAHQVVQLLAAAPISDTWQLSLDPIRGATEARVGATPTPLLSVNATPDPPDGTYFGMLTLYNGEEAVAHQPVFTARIAQGQVAVLDPVPFTIESAPAGPPPAPLPATWRTLLGGEQALDGQQALLEQVVLTHPSAWPGAGPEAPLTPGASPSVQLHWRAVRPPVQPLMVSVQLLGGDDHKWAQWDGPVGGDWRPIQIWQPGERVRQDVPLAIDGAIPPGEYRLLVVVYDPATGQPQPFGGQNVLQLGELAVR